MNLAEEEAPNNNLCSSKQGLPTWMKNFGRLASTTDFEKYGSPPEAESSFLTDYHKHRIKCSDSNMQEYFLTGSAEEYASQKSQSGSFSNSFLYDPQFSNGMEQKHSHLPVPALSSLLLESLTDDTSSSTDTTPFVTPQGSPLISRRNTGESMHCSLAKELAAINTRKWLRKGFVPEGIDAGTEMPKTKKQMKQLGSTSPSSKGKKCNVSNFDINAVSPSSW